MHYRDIANAIAEQELRTSEDMGATPANTVNAMLRCDKLKTKVVNVRRGMYALAELIDKTPSILIQSNANNNSEDDEESDNIDAMITAFGRFWDRKLLNDNELKILGININSKSKYSIGVDFSDHPGIYILHRGFHPVYVGQASQLSTRIAAHQNDDKRTRWDNFSWFSIKIFDNQEIEQGLESKNRILNNKALLDTLEALLIEILGPDRNKKDGNEFNDKEFEQISSLEFLKILQNKKNKK